MGLEGMVVEERLNKVLYKAELYLIKVIPMIIAFIYLLNTTLSYFYIDLPILSYIIMFLLMAFLYLSSFIFKFCSWHRLFLHYIMVNLILNIIDLYVGIPLSDRGLFIMYMSITGISLFVLLYLKFKKWIVW